MQLHHARQHKSAIAVANKRCFLPLVAPQDFSNGLNHQVRADGVRAKVERHMAALQHDNVPCPEVDDQIGDELDVRGLQQTVDVTALASCKL